MHFKNVFFQPNKKKMNQRLESFSDDKVRQIKLEIDKKITKLQNKLLSIELKFEAKYKVQINYDRRSVEESDFIIDGLSDEQINSILILQRNLEKFTLGTKIKLNICRQLLDVIDKHLGIKYENNKSALSVRTKLKPSKYYGYGTSNERFQILKKN